MLQAIREKFIGWALWTLIGIIIIPFAFFGIETFRTGGNDPQVAKVGGQRITESQVQNAYEQRLRQLQQLLGDKFNASDFDQARFREAVLKDLVQESLLRQFVTDQGFRAGDAQVVKALQAIPAFQDQGTFSRDLYRARLANLGYTPERFETTVRESLVSDQLRDGLVLTAFNTDVQAQQAQRLAQQKRSVRYATFAPARLRNSVRVTEEQVRARYQERPSEYLAPERIRVAYLDLSLSALPPAAPPQVEILKAMYETEKNSRYTKAEERRARHILIPFGADKSAAQAKAQALADKLKGGDDFAALAAAHSLDSGSKSQGGSLGWIKRGQMAEAFEKALFSLGPGELTAPVETEFGWHLIRLDEVRAAQVRRFEDADVQRELLDIYRARESEKRFQELSEKLEQLAFESPASLEPAAKALGLQVQTSDWLTRKPGTGLFADAKLLEAAFSDDVVKQGENSRPVSAGPGRVLVMRKQEYEASRTRPLAEVSDRIRETLADEAARKEALEQAQSLLKSAKLNGDLGGTAGAEVRNPGAIVRTQADVPAEVRLVAFSLPRPVNGKAQFGLAELPDGARAVVAVSAVEEGGAPDPAAAAQARDALAGAEFAAYRQYVESQYSVKLNTLPAVQTP